MLDLVILTRNDDPLDAQVAAGVRAQAESSPNVIRVIGHAAAEDRNRWDTIARARNRAKTLSNNNLLMFLDDDVVLAPGTISRLADFLQRHPDHGAAAANYLGIASQRGNPHHVAMGATLFRRDALQQIRFRWERQLCECLCCCYDLRALGKQISYVPGVAALHLGDAASHSMSQSAPVARPEARSRVHAKQPGHESAVPTDQPPGVILTAFNRRHLHPFRERFLPSLRNSGNMGLVVAVTYGLTHSEIADVRALPNVHVVARPDPGLSPARLRVWDFVAAMRGLDDRQPVAYWDAGDVLFQSSLAELWNLARHSDPILLVAEPTAFRNNPSMVAWSESIRWSINRQAVSDHLTPRPVINGGFAAGTVAAMRRYLTSTQRILQSTSLRGTSDTTDQLALNVACHFGQTPFQLIDERWNYCLYGRDVDSIPNNDNRAAMSDRAAISVLHGNGGTTERLAKAS